MRLMTKPGPSNAAIARALGVSKWTIAREAPTTKPRLVLGLDGKTYVTHEGTDPLKVAAVAHELIHQGNSYRSALKILDETYGIKRSVGWMTNVLRRYKCSDC